MKRWIRLAVAGGLLASALGLAANGAAGTVPNGRIAFMRFDPTAGDQFVWTSNPDGTHEELVVPYPAERPHWSPDGRELLFLCCEAENIMNMATGQIRRLHAPAGLFLGCLAWSADGQRILCEGYGDTDPALNGIYSMRASDGGDVRRITANPDGSDIPQDSSPDGSQLVFVSDRDMDSLFVVDIDGGNLRRLDTGGLLDVSSASWSPDGAWLVFPARKGDGERRSLFLMHPDGTGLHEIAMDPACGGVGSVRSSRGCLDPTWSPDGSKILFAILPASTLQKRLYMVDLDGSHLTRVTRHGFVLDDPGEGEAAPDWGTHPLE